MYLLTLSVVFVCLSDTGSWIASRKVQACVYLMIVGAIIAARYLRSSHILAQYHKALDRT